MKKFALILFLFLTGSLLAQKENNIWYFGDNAGIDFNNGTRVALIDGQLNAYEGCATVCDSIGNLLFYTDGITIWNKNHNVMFNGNSLKGGGSSTESAIIVKKPNSDSIYYVFTMAHFSYPDGMRYSIVDMSLFSGLGGVITKNILLATPMTEKLIAVKHHNNKDFWIIAHKAIGNEFYSYLLTSTGIDTIPKISTTGINIPFHPLGHNGAGHMKASPDRSRIAVAHSNLYIMELFQFDNSTGLLSNPLTINNYSNTIDGYPYGVEFSPNGNFLYVSCSEGTNNDLYQYNLMLGTDTAIINSRISIYSDMYNAYGGTIQLGIDDKIYLSKLGSSWVNVIKNPNALGLACNFIVNEFNLGGKSCNYGFPPLHDFSNLITYSYLCEDDSTLFSTSALDADSVLWDFGDTISAGSNTSLGFNPKHQFTNSGNYIITLIVYSGLNTDTITNTLHISPYPTINLGPDTTFCQGEILTLTATPFNGNFLWQDGSTDTTFIASVAGIYWVESTLNNCTSLDSITINYSNPNVNLGNDTVLCNGFEIILDATTSGATYLWQDTSTGAIINVTSQGTYWVTVTVNNCSTTDSIIVNYTVLPNINLGNDTTLCLGQMLILDATFPYSTYLWNDNSSNPVINIGQAGTYTVDVTNNCGTAIDTLKLTYYPALNVSIAAFNPDTLCYNGNSVPLPIGIPVGGSYSGSGVSGSNFDPVIAGIGTHNVIYTITDTNSCLNSDTTIIVVSPCVGINENLMDYGILIYPNPNTGFFTIEKPNGLNKEVKVKLLDATSKLILDKVIPIDKQKIEMDITQYSRGIYYLQLIIEEKVFVKQILKN